ncbi:uncharacterized protein C8Q71DRAFT_849202 [Rhodofomes roseus]|uniref:Uncharacterized protein n=1 Tax=Rhodofomes roseus TaxID=34475 RepID=A0ABQ8KBJ0_9APHY|nr:uncharacterized protein C8Q71DRAFT_849202 [Rhodofomes roseus]KAH9834921.1 hypothetical protein C8Q71DRAFT_849202 [Rhodofomes roseus]
METGLFFNVSGCSTSYASNAKQPSRHALPSYLVYACRFWIEHLTMSSISEEQATQHVWAFFRQQFLYWLEVLSVCNHADVASSLVKRLEVWLRDKYTKRNTERTDVTRCLRLLLDANDFLIRFRTPIIRSAPHMYISALAFTPPQSEIGQAYHRLLKRGLKMMASAAGMQGRGRKLASRRRDLTFRILASRSHRTDLALRPRPGGTAMSGTLRWITALDGGSKYLRIPHP